jgi:hypothetical protein
MNKIWAWRIDPEKRSIAHIQLDQDNWFYDIKRNMVPHPNEERLLLERFDIFRGCELWLDEEGLLKEPQYCFEIECIENQNGIHPATYAMYTQAQKYEYQTFTHQFVGVGIIIGNNPENPDLPKSCPLTLAQVGGCVEFLHPSYRIEPKVSFRLIEGD